MRKSGRKISLLLVLALAFVLLGGTLAYGAPFGLALSWTGDPATAIHVSWRDSENTDACLQLVTQEAYDRTAFEEAAEFAASVEDVSLDGGAWNYQAEAASLRPNTAYVYRVGSEETGWSEQKTFRTQAADSGTVTFAYLGDVQPSDDTEEDYARWGELCRTLYEQNPALACVLLGGDMVNSGISLEQFDLFRANGETLFSRVPMFATAGNHESNFLGGKPELMLKLFAWPENGPEGFEEEFYSLRVGDCQVLVLNSWIYSGEQNLTEADYARVNAWIASELAGSTARWQVVVTHVPVQAVHSDHTSAALLANWAPIFEQYGVDLVLEGHQHVYSRSYPLLNGRIDEENGIPYIMGVSGSKFYDSADESKAACTIYGTSNYQLVEANADSLIVSTRDTAGQEMDFVSVNLRSFTLTRGEYIELLWQAAGSPAPVGVSPFRDDRSDSVAWAYEEGLILGYGNGSFGGGDLLSDAQRELIQARR